MPAENWLHQQPVHIKKQRHYLRGVTLDGEERGGTEATDLLTGQLEGLNPLSWLNFPDRVGMQQGDGPSRGSEDRGTVVGQGGSETHGWASLFL